jgi:hypothetical protein
MISRSNLKIHGVEEGAEMQTTGIENLPKKITAENSLNLGIDIDIPMQEAYRMSSRYDQKITSPCHIILKM